MSMISSVTSAAATLVAGLAPVTTSPKGILGMVAGAIGGLATARKPDALTAKTTAKPYTKSATKTTAKAATTVKKSTTTAAKTASASSGYSKAASDDFAFLKDPTLSVEEKLFRFMCAVAKRNDDEVLKKMEEMKGGAAAGASGSSSSGGSSNTKKSGGVSVWGALKSLIPPLGMAAQLVGDAKLKSMIKQVSGPVLAAAATALGMPALAPLALKAGPGLASAIMDGKLGGGEAAAAAGAASSSNSPNSSSGSTSSPATGKNEQVQMMELQRLVDKQKEMFAMISNVLRAQHDTRMSIIGNVR
jgi:hypothetical protein